MDSAQVGLFLLLIGIRTTLQSPSTDSINNFSYRLLQDTQNNVNGNFILSPVSVGTLLAMLESGAQGETRQELQQALQYLPQLQGNSAQIYSRVIQYLKNRKGYSKNILEFDNQVYFSKNLNPIPQYVEYIDRNFFTGAQTLDFQNSAAAAETINNWVTKATKGKINNLVQPGSISKDTRLVLTNAIYFHGLWKKPFSINYTIAEDFSTDPNLSGTRIHSKDSRSIKKVSMMKQINRFVAGSDASMRAKWVHLPFDNDEFSMVLVMPTDEEGINSLCRRLTKENIDKIIHAKSEKTVVLGLPRFKISAELSLAESLKRLGVQKTFGPGADFRPISNDRLFVNKIFHKAEIEVNEEGSTAAAASAVLVNTLSLLSDDLSFYANQPFLLFLIKNDPRYILFVGQVTDP